LDTAYRHTD